MALSSIVKLKCPTCSKIAVEVSKSIFGNSRIIRLECGHSVIESTLNNAEQDIAKILNGCTLMPYQVEAVQFLGNADARALLCDEMGLGKTLEVLALIKLYCKQLLPCIIVCPTTVKLQWHHEIIDKCGVMGFLTQVIGSGKELAAPGFDIYVTTYDLLKKEKCFDMVKDDIKLVVIDECQKIKNHSTERAKAVQKICTNVTHIIPMSGTPIKNHAGEYFTVLNLVRPRMFPHYATFLERECDSYKNGWGVKVGGLKNPTLFHEKTKDFILRRTKADVLPDLPELMRKFQHVELDRKYNKFYDQCLTELDDLYYNEKLGGLEKSGMMLAIMNKLRWVIGLSKVDDCVEFVEDFIESNDRKIVVFAHHHDVVDRLQVLLNNYMEENGMPKVLNLTSSLDQYARQDMVMKFKNDDRQRVMIASTQAAGEALNIQFCSDAVMLERQWNPANEEQAEGRFHRFGQKHSVSVTYMIASETIDDYFTQLVEQKRMIVASTLDNKEIAWDQNSLMSELIGILMSKGKKAWTLERI